MIYVAGGFGSTNTTTPFGQSSFGKPTTGFSTPAFGAPTGTSLFGQNAQPAQGGLFGAANKGTTFGQQPAQPGFGWLNQLIFSLSSFKFFF